MWHRSRNGSAWTADWESLGGIFSSTGSPPAVVLSCRPVRVDIFRIGANDQMLHKAFWDGAAAAGGWIEWEDLGGIFVSPPAAVSWGPDRVHIFGLGTDNAMWHKAWDGSAWTADWESLGGIFNSPPAVVSWGPDRVDVFGLGTDNAMWHKAWDGEAAWLPSATGMVFLAWGLTTACIIRPGMVAGGVLRGWVGNILVVSSPARRLQ
ncbi:hypothetical protein B0T26DRAFT_724432 [Lasiosphaeria miniovina]|uniref:PLL-like beta propeller domain-containing protein n=1 Tax=Lasiosphaeria miniovina TaxID=1954250 RepID=A0AA40A6L2_9PEZI|nr:uncharacterized protein B0T26DRAFT_724432 [Lasiosphaeria miniovina]KAK0710261.1 hypothetical protein B0T26DRAFT_724432 [Lasiosphaeria miniovina]